MIHGRIRETEMYKRVRAFLQRNERLMMPSMLLGGTIIDAVQFRVLRIETTFLFMAAYAMLCVAAMAVMAAPERPDRTVARYTKLAAPLVQQFTIGALLSTALLFYWFSGALSASWPILGAVALLMVSNEVLRAYFKKPIVQATVFFFALFSLATSFAAYVLNSISPWAFVAGGIASLLVMAGALVVVIKVGALGAQSKIFWLSVTAVFALMNAAYFLNLIPPIPLSLRDAGIYRDIMRQNGEYILVGDDETFLAKLIPGQTLTVRTGESLFAFTAIHAPAQLSTVMVHRWEYFDANTHDWVTSDRLSFRIEGGREEGYRGYSMKSTLTEGKWRVTVETMRGQVLGRIRFTVLRAAQ